jgi:hypothetical protein
VGISPLAILTSLDCRRCRGSSAPLCLPLSVWTESSWRRGARLRGRRRGQEAQAVSPDGKGLLAGRGAQGLKRGGLECCGWQVREAMLASGFVASVTADAVFVRFLGGLTGRAGLGGLADTFVSDARRHFSEGQSVRAQVVQVRARSRRKASLCSVAGPAGRAVLWGCTAA